MATSEAVYENGAEEIPPANGKKPRNTFLDHFGKLTSNVQKIRLKSGCQIIRHLGRNSENVEELQYAVARLVRGLGSSKINSRIGFYTTFNVLLQSSNTFDLNNIISVIQKELKTSGQNLKSENADVYTGLILVCGAVLHSGKLPALDNEKKKALLQHLVDASGKKSYLGLLAASLMVDALPKLESKLFAEDILPVLRPQLKKPLTDYTVDQLYLLLKCEEAFPAVINAKFLSNLIDTPKIITEGNTKAIIHVLLDVAPSKCIAQHPVYNYIAKQFTGTTFLAKILHELDNNFERFTLVKHQVLLVLSRFIVDNLEQQEHIVQVFGKNLLLETLRHFKATTIKQQDDIKLAAVQLFNSLSHWAKKDGISSAAKVSVMETLLFYPGTFIFEKTTGIKVLQHITATLDVDGVKRLGEIYRAVMLGEIEKKKNDKDMEYWLNLDRIYASQLIVKLINHPAMRTDVEQKWKIEHLKLLMEVGLLKKKNVGMELCKNLKETFFSALDFKFGKLQDVIAILSQLVHSLNENVANDKLRNALDAESAKLWAKTLALIDKIEGKSKQGHLTMVFHTLFLQMSLQLFNDVNVKLAVDSLNELFSCYERRKSKDDEIQWIEVVVDLFLNLLSHNSHLLRGVIGKVFPHLCKHLTPSAIQQILHVLDPKSDANPLSESHSDDDDDSGEDEEDAEEEEEEDEEDEESMSDDDEDNDDYEETQNDKLRLALQDALRKQNKSNKSNSTELSDAESVDLDDMSETEAENLNAALGEAFKNFRPNLKKKTKKQLKDEATLTHFRVRVMDLIDVYLDSPEVTMLNALEVMLPLLQSLEFSIRDAHQKPLHDRIKSSLKKLASLKTFASFEDVDETVLSTLLQSILDKGSKSTLVVQEMGDKIADCCMFIVNCSSLIGSSKKLAGYLTEVLKTFFGKRDCLTPYVLFKNIMNSQWERSVSLVAPLIGYVFDEEIRPFRRRQALELLRIFYLNNRLISAHKEQFAKKLAKCEMKLRDSSVEFLQGKEYKTKEPFVIGLFLLLSAVRNCAHQTDVFDWTQLGGLVREYRSGIALTNDGKQAFSKLCSALKVTNIVKMQAKTVKLSLINREVDKDDTDDEEEKAVVEKKKGNKEAKRLKKAARTLRMQSLSEGFPNKKSFSFAETEAEVNELDEDDAEGAEMNGHQEHEAHSGDEAAAVNGVLKGKGKGKGKGKSKSKAKQSKKRTSSESELQSNSTPAESPKKKKKKKEKK